MLRKPVATAAMIDDDRDDEDEEDGAHGLIPELTRPNFDASNATVDNAKVVVRLPPFPDADNVDDASARAANGRRSSGLHGLAHKNQDRDHVAGLRADRQGPAGG